VGDLAPPTPRPFLAMAGDTIVFLAVLVLLYFGFLTVRPVLPAIVLAAAGASLATRLFGGLLERLGGRRRLAAISTVILLFLGFFAPLGLLATVVVQRLIVEGTELAHKLQLGGPLSVERLAPHLGPLSGVFERAATELRPRIVTAGPALARSLGGLVAAASQAAFRIGIGLFLIGVALYYFFLDGPRWRQRLVRLLPLPEDDTRMFFERFHRVSVAVLIGNLGTALTQAAAATLGYVIFGAPVPLIWGAATLFAALIPLVGPALVWLPVALVVGLDRGWSRGVGLALYGLGVVSTVDNIVRPLLTKQGLQLHPLLVFVAVFGGVMAFGIAGLFLGPLVVVLVVTTLDVYERHVSNMRTGG
jgi:predicted PurR-regulated permease PerM